MIFSPIFSLRRRARFAVRSSVAVVAETTRNAKTAQVAETTPVAETAQVAETTQNAEIAQVAKIARLVISSALTAPSGVRGGGGGGFFADGGDPATDVNVTGGRGGGGGGFFEAGMAGHASIYNNIKGIGGRGGILVVWFEK